MKTKPDCATVRVAGDGACLWSWFSSVQAATHNERGDQTRTAHHSGWDISFWFAVSSPLLGPFSPSQLLPDDPEHKNIAPGADFGL